MNQAVDIHVVDGELRVDVTQTPRRWWQRTPRTVIAASVAIVAAVTGAIYIAAPAATESTDDAYVEADVTSVAPRVHGFVAAVLVHDNEAVRAGDPLVRIDAEEFDARVASADADLRDAEAASSAASAALTSLDAEEKLAAARVGAAQTAIRAAVAQSDRASTDRVRFDRLVGTGAVPAHDADTVRAAAISAEQDVARAQALLSVAHEEGAVTAARRSLLVAGQRKADALVARARAALELARQDQSHALIVAPIDGVVGNRQVQQGDYVQPGSRLMTLVPLGAVYVTANFKETQTPRMHPGQHAVITVDAMPGIKLTGAVDSFAPGSGSQFALLPFEPGTGNFTKIVQRLPVRIHFEPGQSAVAQLRPGLSVTARVRLVD